MLISHHVTLPVSYAGEHVAGIVRTENGARCESIYGFQGTAKLCKTLSALFLESSVHGALSSAATAPASLAVHCIALLHLGAMPTFGWPG